MQQQERTVATGACNGVSGSVEATLRQADSIMKESTMDETPRSSDAPLNSRCRTSEQLSQQTRGDDHLSKNPVRFRYAQVR